MIANKKNKGVVTKLNTYISNFLKDTSPALKSSWSSETNQQALINALQQQVVKNKNTPKKGKSSYIIFCSVIRADVKKTNPNMKATDITVEMGRRWREMSDSEKGIYVNLAIEDKNRYIKDMELTGIVIKPVAVKKKSAYINFCAEKRTELKSSFPINKELMVEIGRLWTLLSVEQKQLYDTILVKEIEKPEKPKKVETEVETPMDKTKPKSKSKPKSNVEEVEEVEEEEVEEVVVDKKKKEKKKDKTK